MIPFDLMLLQPDRWFTGTGNCTVEMHCRRMRDAVDVHVTSILAVNTMYHGSSIWLQAMLEAVGRICRHTLDDST